MSSTHSSVSRVMDNPTQGAGENWRGTPPPSDQPYHDVWCGSSPPPRGTPDWRGNRECYFPENSPSDGPHHSENYDHGPRGHNFSRRSPSPYMAPNFHPQRPDFGPSEEEQERRLGPPETNFRHLVSHNENFRPHYNSPPPGPGTHNNFPLRENFHDERPLRKDFGPLPPKFHNGDQYWNSPPAFHRESPPREFWEPPGEDFPPEREQWFDEQESYREGGRFSPPPPGGDIHVPHKPQRRPPLLPTPCPPATGECVERQFWGSFLLYSIFPSI